jgi:hypothetical protein
MSEYIEVETTFTDDPDVIVISTNLTLAEHGEEMYQSIEDMEEGSAVAQALALVEGIDSLRIYEKELELRRKATVNWHNIVADINSSLRDFFL